MMELFKLCNKYFSHDKNALMINYKHAWNMYKQLHRGIVDVKEPSGNLRTQKYNNSIK